ncbi:DOMON-like domain-containing protein [Sphingobium sufflavum]|uniref:DOMON-like domain-containing protein n=1 Tax=Sphingobium sufflavum TaxID=1129547 RepID=UPI001F4605B3|nr:DOMON-like domain-containing protein [Sphingobium sufflavum]MCE7798220.1 DOMON-like domain-containing protein [Sphingobium sufflavum]
MLLTLIRHPSSPTPSIDAITVAVTRLEGARLALRYRITGDISTLAVPALVAAERTDELWKTTCFEAFLKLPDKDQYVEFNFSPSTRWASYVFDDYRQGQRDLVNFTLPRIDLDVARDSFELCATLDLTGNRGEWQQRDLAMGLSAVIETLDGQKSYWALAHPPANPDFHHGDCFAAILRAPESA